MDVLKFFTVRLCPWDMHLTGRRRRIELNNVQQEEKLNFMMGNNFIAFYG